MGLRHDSVRTLGAGNLFTSVRSIAPFVAVKLDVEGYEFKLLRRLFVTQPRALCDLYAIGIEWHENRLLPSADKPIETYPTLRWLLEDEARGVRLLKWV